MKIVDFLAPEAVLPDFAGGSAAEVLAELCRPAAAALHLEPDRLLHALLDREKLGSTGVGEGVAIPHCKLAAVPAIRASFARAPAGVDFRAIDGKPVRIFVALFAPENSSGIHLKALSRISRLFRIPAFREAILAAPGAAEIHRLIAAEDARD